MLQYPRLDPVLHALIQEKPDTARLLIEAGFTCNKVYKEPWPHPCYFCILCATELYHLCEEPNIITIDISPEFVADEKDYNDLVTLIQEKKLNNI